MMNLNYPIRVLQVFGWMERGGAESMIMEIYRHIDRSKVQFDFVVHTTKECAYDSEIRSLGGRIFSVPSFSGKNFFAYKKAWKRLLSEHDEWNIIHSHIRSTATIFLPIANRLGKYTIIHSHNTSSGSGIKACIKSILQSRLKYIANYYLACSEVAGKWLFGEEVTNSENYAVIHNAIDTNDFCYNEATREKVRQDYNFGEKLVIGNVGSFKDQKNHAFLLDIFYELSLLRPDAVLLLVGDGKLREKLVKKAAYLGITEKVIFAGVRSDVNELIQAMDLFVFPSKYEGLPVTLIEAQVSGIPIIMSDSISSEAVITSNLVSTQSLKNSPKQWAEHVLSRTDEIRTARSDEVINSGYDICSTSKWLENFYLERS